MGTQGDGFLVVFPRTQSTVAAAADAQRSLAGGLVRVRIGVHTGEPSRTAEGYVGLDLHMAPASRRRRTEGRCCSPPRLARSQVSPCAILAPPAAGFGRPVRLFQLGARSFRRRAPSQASDDRCRRR